MWYSVSHHFGFGMMDAAAMVELAMNWTRVPDQHRCQVDSTAQPRYCWMFIFQYSVQWPTGWMSGS